MIVYLASPNTQQQAEHVADMPVLLSFAVYRPWMSRYQQTFRRILIDSGAFSSRELRRWISAPTANGRSDGRGTRTP